jgi:hypothetical protein
LKKEKKTIFLSAENWMYVEKNHVQKERRWVGIGVGNWGEVCIGKERGTETEVFKP